MTKRTTKFQKKNLILLGKIKEILEEFEQQGFRVTLRQLYYQLVARGLIPNKKSEYAKLSGLLTNARYIEEIEWDAIEDRTRVPHIPQTFKDVGELIRSAKYSYQLDRWEGQKYYLELWTEKEALVSVIKPVCEKYQIVLCVNKGYSSASAMHEASERGGSNKIDGSYDFEEREKIILYLGDHDPSGIDMDRDILDRLDEFNDTCEVIRIGLTKEQIKKYHLPPNATKQTDPRYKTYSEKYGETCWEVDALRPEVLQELIEKHILKYLDVEKYEQVKEKEKEDLEKLEEYIE